MNLITQRIRIGILIFVILGLIFSCAQQRGVNSNNFTENLRIRYNSFHSIDELLEKVEKNSFLSLEGLQTIPVLVKSNLEYNSDINLAITKMEELLPKVANTNFQQELYFKLGKANFFKEDYYTAYEYFDLVKDNSMMVESKLWKSKSLHQISKYKESLAIVDSLHDSVLNNKSKGSVHVIKAINYFKLNELDSCMSYLHQAIKTSLAKNYKQTLIFNLGQLYMGRDNNLAKYYLRKIAKSNSVDDQLKIVARMNLIQLQYDKIEQRKEKMLQILDDGYTIGKEEFVYFFIANEYAKQNEIDSTLLYSQKVFNNDKASVLMKNQLFWTLGNIYIENAKFSLARENLETIDKNYVIGLDHKSSVLVNNCNEWLNHLEAVYTFKNGALKDYENSLLELAYFYKKINLNVDAELLIRDLVKHSNAQKLDYLLELALLDTNEINKLNQHYSNLLAQQQQFSVLYDSLYSDYEGERFEDVIRKIDEALNEYEISDENKSKLAYLKSFAIGHSQPVDSLLEAFRSIGLKYRYLSVDSLVRKHIAFINAHYKDYSKNNPALQRPRYSNDRSYVLASNSHKTHFPDTTAQNIGTFIDYQLPKHEPYYFIVMVQNSKINLAPTRYALGQFLRTSYRSYSYGHQLIELEEGPQLIKVGLFDGLNQVKDFEDNILQLLPQIIKIEEKKYTTFVIPKSILDQSNSMSQINEYLKKYFNM